MKNISVCLLLITPLWPVREQNEAMAFWPMCSTPCSASVDTTLLEERPLRESVCVCVLASLKPRPASINVVTSEQHWGAVCLPLITT